jgi:hypothetical protein
MVDICEELLKRTKALPFRKKTGLLIASEDKSRFVYGLL